MDWIHENRLKTILIVGLLAVNLVMVYLLWWKMPVASPPPVADDPKRISGSAALMKQVLDLSDLQTQKIDAVLRTRREEAKPVADSLASLKMKLAEELFMDPPDTMRAVALASEIGKAQSKVELTRFRNFREILNVLTTEQKAAFKPVVVDLFGRKPPREDALTAPRRTSDTRGEQRTGQVDDKRPEPRRSQGGREEKVGETPPPPRDGEPRSPGDGKSGPPTVEEKLSRYVKRLRLTDAQARSVEEILTASREKGRALRDMSDPDRAAVDAAKEQIRKEEDEQIMQILRADQQKEFTAMRARKPR